MARSRGWTRAGAWIWLGCLQFFVAEQVARFGWQGHYNFRSNYISDLGARGCTTAICSHWHTLMDGSFLLQGVLIAAGAVLLPRRVSPGALGWAARVFLLLSALGVAVVGYSPEDVDTNLHISGARLHFACGSLAMLLWGLASVVRRDDAPQAAQAAGAAFLAAGVATCGDLLLSLGSSTVNDVLSAGLVERLAAYPLPLWLAWTGWTLLRNRRRPATVIYSQGDA